MSFAQFDSHEIMVLELALRRTLGITGVLQLLGIKVVKGTTCLGLEIPGTRMTFQILISSLLVVAIQTNMV